MLVSINIEVAGRVINLAESKSMLTLSPMPTTIESFVILSAKIPQILCSPTSKSFGHFVFAVIPKS